MAGDVGEWGGGGGGGGGGRGGPLNLPFNQKSDLVLVGL